MTATKPVRKKPQPIPRTPAYQFRLTDGDLSDLESIRKYYRLSTRTDALRYAIGAARREIARDAKK